jgi:hypothetical protein
MEKTFVFPPGARPKGLRNTSADKRGITGVIKSRGRLFIKPVKKARAADAGTARNRQGASIGDPKKEKKLWGKKSRETAKKGNCPVPRGSKKSKSVGGGGDKFIPS